MADKNGQTGKHPGTNPAGRPANSDATAEVARDLAVLRACLEPAPLAEVARRAGIARSSTHRRVSKLVRRGLVTHGNGRYAITESGQRLLDEGTPAPEKGDPLLEAWPFLKFFPTLVHRSVTALALFAWFARTYDLVDDRNPALVLVGGTQKLKSWVIKCICILTGTTWEKARLPMTQIRGRGLLARLDGKGRKIYQSDALRENVIWLEELSLSDPAVKRDVESLLHGPKTIRVENEMIEVKAVPIIELNARKKEGSLEERVGLDTPRLRRCIVADFAKVEVTARMRSQSPSQLEKIRSMGSVRLPSAAPPPLGEGIQALVDQAFAACIKPDSLDFVDSSRILTLIAGARAILSEEAAAKAVLEAYFVLAETTKFVHDDWQSRLVVVFRACSAPKADTKPQGEAGPAAGEETADASTAPAAEPASMNPFDLDGILLRIKDLVDKAGFHLPDDEKQVSALLHIAHCLAKKDVTPEQFVELADEAGSILDLGDLIDDLGSTEERVRELQAVGTFLEQKGVSLKGVKEFVEYHLRLQSLGFNWASAEAVARAIDAERRKGESKKKAVGFLLSHAAAGLAVQAVVGRLETRRQELDAQREHLADELKTVQHNLARYQAAYQRIVAQWQEAAQRIQSSLDTRRRIMTEATEAQRQVATFKSNIKDLEGRLKVARLDLLGATKTLLLTRNLTAVNEVLHAAITADGDRKVIANMAFAEIEELCGLWRGARWAYDREKAIFEKMEAIAQMRPKLIPEVPNPFRKPAGPSPSGDPEGTGSTRAE